MKVDLRIPGQIYARALDELSRPHFFAAERVGFFSVALGRLSDGGRLLLVNDFHSVSDEDYLDDPDAGARIGSRAIRSALQRIMDSGFGQFHVHLHDHDGYPHPSRMDEREMPALLKSMAVVGTDCAHGAIILSRDRAWAQASIPRFQNSILPATVTVVGFPFRFLKS